MKNTKIRRCVTFVRLFKPQFAAAVESGLKCQTVRPTPKRMPRPGDRISLRCWTGAPYRSKQHTLREAVISDVLQIAITPEGWVWLNEIRIKTRSDFEAFAKADGFDTPEAMLDWFRNNHGLPFDGIVIKWSNIEDLISPRSTSGESPCDNKGVAATVEEGTARKPVDVNAEPEPGEPIAGTSKGDSRERPAN